MTVQLALPKEIEDWLLAEVRAGKHPSLEAAILNRLVQDKQEQIGGDDQRCIEDGFG